MNITGCDRCLDKPLRQKKKKIEEESGQAARQNENVGSQVQGSDQKSERKFEM